MDMRPNFERVAEVVWNQLKQTIPRLMRGDQLTSPELFGASIPLGSQSRHRGVLIETGIVKVSPGNVRMSIGDVEKAKTFIQDPMTVAAVLWPSEAEEWRAMQEHAKEVRLKNAPPVIQSKRLPEDMSAARAALSLNRPPQERVVPKPKPEPKVEAVKPPEPKPEPKIEAPVAPPPAQNEDLVEIEMAKLKLMHATAENMVYIRDRLDGLIKRPVPQPPAPPPAPEPIKVPVLPKEIPVTLTVVNAEHIEARFEAIEQQLNEVLTILRKLL